MTYPKIPDLNKLKNDLFLYAQLKHEYGSKNIQTILIRAEKALHIAVADLKQLPVDKKMAAKEPNSLKEIKKLRPKGPRRMWKSIDKKLFREKLEGAMLGRFAGCTLGAPVEGWPIKRMELLAKENGDKFPPENYWKHVPDPHGLRYNMSKREDYTQLKMNGVPVDDDIAYTLLGLLVVEDNGPNFTVEDNGKAWKKYLPYACTAEDIALKNLKKGVPAAKAGVKDNPYTEWIGADIRSDPWGYMAPAYPEFAAEMAYKDAYLSHRRQGIYGEMFFSATIAAAFAAKDAVEAIKIGLTEIPAECSLAKAVKWALHMAPKIKSYYQARGIVDKKFAGMSHVHTTNNACLTIFGLTIGKKNVTRVLGQTVAMGLDNDCTAATAGSIVGALVGKKGIPSQWHRNFNNTVHSYLIKRRKFTISGLVDRFEKQALRIHKIS